jgi:4-hydroxythreonine-4-phosphate dehydrogenase
MSAATIGITLGDPAGIGPEIALAAAIELTQVQKRDIKLILFGVDASLAAAARALKISGDWKSAVPGVGFVAVGGDEKIETGQWSAATGKLACLAVDKAVEYALDGRIDAIATAPISKEAVNAAGIPFTGHTEYLAKLTGVSGTVMMLAHGKLRVSHISTHIPLAKASQYVTRERIRRVVTLTAETLRRSGIAQPHIAICGFNPHAGEGGLLGDEERLTIEPAIAELRAEGYRITGPVPGDTVFVKAAGGMFDAVVAMYHDQGHIPVKLLGFSVGDGDKWQNLSGVNVTLGLPIVRTSVDHGTAFDIAGKGIASAQSMIEAVDYACALVGAGAGRWARFPSALAGEGA